MFSLLSARPEFYAKRAMQWQLILYVAGLALGILFPSKDSLFILYYFEAWFGPSVLANITLIVYLALKRPQLYLFYILFLLVLPVVLGFFSMIFIMLTSGTTC